MSTDANAGETKEVGFKDVEICLTGESRDSDYEIIDTIDQCMRTVPTGTWPSISWNDRWPNKNEQYVTLEPFGTASIINTTRTVWKEHLRLIDDREPNEDMRTLLKFLVTVLRMRWKNTDRKAEFLGQEFDPYDPELVRVLKIPRKPIL